MLTLSRKESEEILIGPNIRVKVISISAKRVKLGITAPSDTLILRLELTGAPEASTETLLGSCPGHDG